MLPPINYHPVAIKYHLCRCYRRIIFADAYKLIACVMESLKIRNKARQVKDTGNNLLPITTTPVIIQFSAEITTSFSAFFAVAEIQHGIVILYSQSKICTPNLTTSSHREKRYKKRKEREVVIFFLRWRGCDERSQYKRQHKSCRLYLFLFCGATQGEADLEFLNNLCGLGTE